MVSERFITIGLGSVGHALTVALDKAGYRPVALVGRGRKAEKDLARRVRTTLLTELTEDIDNIDFILLAVQTSKIEQAAGELAQLGLPWRRLTVLHASGSYGISPLAALRKKGAGVATMHPYQTFPKGQPSVNLKGITYGITGNARGTTLAKKITRRLGGKPLELSEKDRMLYHLSAILACTFVAADIDMAVQVLKSMDVSERRALEAVIPIANETIRNVSELGIRAAMTGPQTRRDESLVKRHVTELRRRLPAIAEVYQRTSQALMAQGKSHPKGKTGTRQRGNGR